MCTDCVFEPSASDVQCTKPSVAVYTPKLAPKCIYPASVIDSGVFLLVVKTPNCLNVVQMHPSKVMQCCSDFSSGYMRVLPSDTIGRI